MLPMDTDTAAPGDDQLQREAEARRAAMARDRFAERAEDEARQAELQALANHEQYKKERRERRRWDRFCEGSFWGTILCC